MAHFRFQIATLLFLLILVFAIDNLQAYSAIQINDYSLLSSSNDVNLGFDNHRIKRQLWEYVLGPCRGSYWVPRSAENSCKMACALGMQCNIGYCSDRGTCICTGCRRRNRV